MDTVRDHQAPTVSVSLREPEEVDNYHRDQQASASTVLSTHMCVSTTNPSAHKLGGGKTKNNHKTATDGFDSSATEVSDATEINCPPGARISDKRNKNEILTLNVSCLLI